MLASPEAPSPPKESSCPCPLPTPRPSAPVTSLRASPLRHVPLQLGEAHPAGRLRVWFLFSSGSARSAPPPAFRPPPGSSVRLGADIAAHCAQQPIRRRRGISRRRHRAVFLPRPTVVASGPRRSALPAGTPPLRPRPRSYPRRARRPVHVSRTPAARIRRPRKNPRPPLLTFPLRPRHAPLSNRRRPASSITGTPSAAAFSSFEPASDPAST